MQPTEPIRPTEPQPIGPYYEESLKLFENFSRSIRSTAEAAATQCEAMMKDYGSFSLIALGGAVTFFTVSPTAIKTITLFFFSVILLLTCVVLTLLVRRAWNKHLLELFRVLDQKHTSIAGAFGSYRINPSAENAGAFSSVVNQQVELPEVQSLAVRGQDAAGILFVIGVVSLAISLIFKVAF